MMIRAIDQKDTRRCLRQHLGRRETAKASPHDDDTGTAIIHGDGHYWPAGNTPTRIMNSSTMHTAIA